MRGPVDEGELAALGIVADAIARAAPMMPAASPYRGHLIRLAAVINRAAGRRPLRLVNSQPTELSASRTLLIVLEILELVDDPAHLVGDIARRGCAGPGLRRRRLQRSQAIAHIAELLLELMHTHLDI